MKWYIWSPRNENRGLVDPVGKQLSNAPVVPAALTVAVRLSSPQRSTVGPPRGRRRRPSGTLHSGRARRAHGTPAIARRVTSRASARNTKKKRRKRCAKEKKKMRRKEEKYAMDPSAN